jgi:hypothetical protein
MVYDPSFAGVSSIGSVSLSTELCNNYKSFLEWGFLNIGAFTNVEIPTKNISNFDLHILKPTNDPSYAASTVYQGPRKDWVYESGVGYNGISPIEFSGIYVNGSFHPAPTGDITIGYRVNYPEGKIIFSRRLSSATVTANYSYKNIQIYQSDEFPYWKEIQHRSLENRTGFSLRDKGDFAISSEYRVQLPAIVIEPVARSNNKPFRLGDKSLVVEQDILLHVLADNPKDKNSIIDAIRLQEDRVIWLYDTNEIVSSGIYPLNYDGSINENGQNYYTIVNNENYRWLKCQIAKINISDIDFANIRMYGSVIRLTNEIIIDSM